MLCQDSTPAKTCEILAQTSILRIPVSQSKRREDDLQNRASTGTACNQQHIDGMNDLLVARLHPGRHQPSLFTKSYHLFQLTFWQPVSPRHHTPYISCIPDLL